MMGAVSFTSIVDCLDNVFSNYCNNPKQPRASPRHHQLVGGRKDIVVERC